MNVVIKTPDSVKKILAFIWGIRYRLYFAKWMLRLGRFYEATEPGVWFALFVGAMASVMFTCMGLLGHEIVPSPKAIATVAVKGAFGFTLGLYLIWEICQGVKALHQWAGRYTRGY